MLQRTVNINPAFLILLQIGALQSAARWLELLAFGVYVFDVTHSPFMVTLVTLVKLAPLALFGPIVGALPSKYPGRTIYSGGLVLAILVSLVSAAIAWSGLLSISGIMLASFLGGIFWAFDFPVRRAMIGEAVAEIKLGRAMAFDTIANNGTRMLGPVLGGMLLQHVGLHGALLVCAIFYVICWYLISQLEIGRETFHGAAFIGIVASVREGLQVVRGDSVLLSTLLVTVIYNLFSFPMLSLVPVLGREQLQLSASAIGVLVAMEGAGALLGGLLFLYYGRVQLYRKTYVFGVICSLFFGLVFSQATDSGTVGTALLMVGIGSACFAAMQTTLLILNSRPKYRSQVLGLLSLSIGAGLIGFTQIGLLASWLGSQTALVISGCCGLLALLLLYLRYPHILGKQL